MALVAGLVWVSVLTRTAGTGGGCLMTRPYASTVRVLENTLRLEASIHRYALPAEAALFDAMGTGTDGSIDEALAAYQELLACDQEVLSDTERRSLQARVGVLLGESGRLREARDHVASLSPPGVEGAIARVMRIAYELPVSGDRRPVGDELELLQHLGGGWTVDRLAIRLARRLGDTDEAAARLRNLDARGRVRLSRLRAWAFLQLLLIVPGLAFLFAWVMGMRVRPRVSTGLIPAPWLATDAVAVLVRGAFMGIGAFLGVIGLITVVGGVEPDAPGITSGWATAVVMLPAVWLARGRLVRPHLGAEQGLLEGLGVDPPHRSLPGLAVNALMPIAGVLIGNILLRRTLWAIGVQSHYTDVIIEPLLWGGPVDAALISLEVIAWAPILEEVIFRGVVYSTLRRYMPPAWAVPLSAVLFAAPHMYSLGGTLEVAFSGLIFALAYERTRSLAPAIAAHAVANASVVVGALLLLS